MIFECKDVTLGYENKVVAKNLNFKIDQGDYLCVVGENGTGKSTLIKTLLGLIKPLNGEVIANVQGKNHKRSRIFATADTGTERFSGKCLGSSFVRGAK